MGPGDQHGLGNRVARRRIEELPGTNTQADTLEEARANLAEAVELVLDANRVLAEERLGARKEIREPLRITA